MLRNLHRIILSKGNCVRKNVRQCSSATKTSLFDFHVQKGGKMVNFGGFMLPVQYADQSISNSHVFTRENASLFDVSHMLQTEIQGKASCEFMETLVTASVKNLPIGSATLTIFTDENGGILDDLIITKVAEDHLFVVSNAGRKEHDMGHMKQGQLAFEKKTREKINIRFYDPAERALLALQGPKAAAALQKLTDVNLKSLYFMESVVGPVAGIKGCRISRCGYTGEDGFEISIPAIKSAYIAEEMLRNEEVKLAGLGARDSLRLEAGLCLYGSDMSTKTTPVEAALTWLVDKQRREAADFPGAKQILHQIKEKSEIKRVGLISKEGPPARHDAIIVSSYGKDIGTVTSGCPAPSLGKNIAMGYVPTEISKAGTQVQLKIRGKLYAAEVAKMPFVPAHYYRKK
ncbi:aminomethyltransferase, mitochondrial-like [Atheta coriaria]|uniref:aminomethyltransferase, mitochondrial-like n=1 Tax=Dalotia coriaria TaxID=877792 RepID=UPI0031F38D7D